ncbi:MAG TPA: capsule biosynthesis protein CapA [Cytophagales bacterium]|nr:capsule biosynthesis protein CapA [Cytophagales bacterium]HAA17518.1 capsule biosynthesis protein CapA [Cytophagales bacterium]
MSACITGKNVQPSGPIITEADTVITRTVLDSLQELITVLSTPIPDSTVQIFAYPLKKVDTLSIIGVGDIMVGTNYPQESYLPPDFANGLWDEVAPILREANVTFGNLEGVILNGGGNVKNCSNPAVCYAFRSPEVYGYHFVNSGFDVMSTANNHAGDFGDPGRENTMRVLDVLGIAHGGQLTKPTATFERDGVRYGFAAFAPNTGTVSINDLPNARRIVKELAEVSDVVIVSFHGGAEGRNFENVPKKREIFYGENRGNVYEFAHAMVDAGADVIFGHGPHVTRAVEVYKDRFIAYSLGNFNTYGRFSLRGVSGIAPIVKVFTQPDGTFLYGKVIPTYQSGEGGARIDPQNRVIKRLQELNAEDFPNAVIRIDDAGYIRYLSKQTP